MKWLTELKLTLTQWIVVSLSIIVGVLLVVFDLKNKELRAAKVKLAEKELDIAIAKDSAKIKQKKKKLKEAKNKLKEVM
jgi:hypothetical protein